MKIELKTANLVDNQEPINPFISAQNQYRQPSARVDGVSFSTNSPPVRRFVIATSIIALGTASITGHSVPPAAFEGHRIVLPETPSASVAPVSARYDQLRQDIIASGVPLLSDEELRQEIQDRKGVRVESES